MLLKERIRSRLDEIGAKAGPLSKDTEGLNETYIRDLLDNDDPNPRIKHLTVLAGALGVSIEWLLTGRGSPEECAPASLGDWPEELQSMWREFVTRMSKAEPVVVKAVLTVALSNLDVADAQRNDIRPEADRDIA